MSSVNQEGSIFMVGRYRDCPKCFAVNYSMAQNDNWYLANWTGPCTTCGYIEAIIKEPRPADTADHPCSICGTPWIQHTNKGHVFDAAIQFSSGLGAGTTILKPGDKVYNAEGGSQSYVPYRFDLILPDWLLEVAQVLHEGAQRHGENNWQKISLDDHLNHAMTHIQEYRTGDRSERHLINVVCRMMFAYWCDKQDQPTDDVDNPISMEY